MPSSLASCWSTSSWWTTVWPPSWGYSGHCGVAQVCGLYMGVRNAWSLTLFFGCLDVIAASCAPFFLFPCVCSTSLSSGSEFHGLLVSMCSHVTWIGETQSLHSGHLYRQTSWLFCPHGAGTWQQCPLCGDHRHLRSPDTGIHHQHSS